ncbi:basic proline-rich protein-like, partial [Melopsittacus undulatus]|uniref:basic proline-rich protein-like n=1 Tax=Melopsittacus undulatus TaxID=13146 RepID=UPI00146C8116
MPGFATLPPARPSLFAPGPQGRCRRQEGAPRLVRTDPEALQSRPNAGQLCLGPKIHEVPDPPSSPPAHRAVLVGNKAAPGPGHPSPGALQSWPTAGPPHPGPKSHEGALVLRLFSACLDSQRCPPPAPHYSPPPHRAIAVGNKAKRGPGSPGPAIAVGNKAQHGPGRSGPASLQARPNARQPRPGPNSHEGDWAVAVCNKAQPSHGRSGPAALQARPNAGPRYRGPKSHEGALVLRLFSARLASPVAVGNKAPPGPGRTGLDALPSRPNAGPPRTGPMAHEGAMVLRLFSARLASQRWPPRDPHSSHPAHMAVADGKKAQPGPGQPDPAALQGRPNARPPRPGPKSYEGAIVLRLFSARLASQRWPRPPSLFAPGLHGCCHRQQGSPRPQHLGPVHPAGPRECRATAPWAKERGGGTGAVAVGNKVPPGPGHLGLAALQSWPNAGPLRPGPKSHEGAWAVAVCKKAQHGPGRPGPSTLQAHPNAGPPRPAKKSHEGALVLRLFNTSLASAVAVGNKAPPGPGRPGPAALQPARTPGPRAQARRAMKGHWAVAISNKAPPGLGSMDTTALQARPNAGLSRPGPKSHEGELVLPLFSACLASERCPPPTPHSSPLAHRAFAICNKAQPDPGLPGPAALQACPNAGPPCQGPKSQEGELVLRLFSARLASAVAVGNKAPPDPGPPGPAALLSRPNAGPPRPGPKSHEGALVLRLFSARRASQRCTSPAPHSLPPAHRGDAVGNKVPPGPGRPGPAALQARPNAGNLAR